MPSVKIRIEKTSPTEEERAKSEEEKEGIKKNAVVSAFTQMAIGNVKSIVNNAVSHTGEWTGNYVKQAGLSQALNIINEVASFGTAAATSLLTQSPIPIIVKSISFASEIGVNLYNDYREQQKYKRDSDYLLARSGNGTINGSRGTEN